MGFIKKMFGARNSAIRESVRNIVAANLYLDKQELHDDWPFVDDLHSDPLDLTNILMNLEREFDIYISEEDKKYITTISNATDYIVSVHPGSNIGVKP